MRKEKPMPNMESLLMKALGLLLALAIVLPLSAAVAAADSYPSKPVRLIVPYAPGGGGDFAARTIASKLSEPLGQQVVVENRGGAAGIIGMEMVAKSAPDGYTLLLHSGALVTNPLFFKVPYDPEKSFTPITLVNSGPVMLVVNPSVPANSVKELIALAKKQPGKLVCVAGGSGTTQHLGSELFKMMAGIDFKIVQFKGAGPAMIDVLGGHSQIMFSTLAVSLSQIKSGKLKVLGFGASVRSVIMPDVPTISEAGLPGYDAAIWWGISAPAGTPKAIVDRLHKELAVILKSEDVKKKFESQGVEAQLMSPAEYGKFMEAETAKWAKVIKEANIKILE